MIILDTNILSELMKPIPDPNVLTWLRAHPLDHLTTTAITVAEMRYGLRALPAGRRRQDLESRFARLLAQGFNRRVLPFDAAAAEAYAAIAVTRQQAGRPIAAFDAMIAAIASAAGMRLAIRNVQDFEQCGLELLNPWEAT